MRLIRLKPILRKSEKQFGGSFLPIDFHPTLGKFLLGRRVSMARQFFLLQENFSVDGKKLPSRPKNEAKPLTKWKKKPQKQQQQNSCESLLIIISPPILSLFFFFFFSSHPYFMLALFLLFKMSKYVFDLMKTIRL